MTQRSLSKKEILLMRKLARERDRALIQKAIFRDLCLFSLAILSLVLIFI